MQPATRASDVAFVVVAVVQSVVQIHGATCLAVVAGRDAVPVALDELQTDDPTFRSEAWQNNWPVYW